MDLQGHISSTLMVTLADYLSSQRILFLNTTTREETLHALVDVAYKDGVVVKPQEFYQALLRREQIVTTGIGMGVAIPHAKLENLEDFFIVMGILHHGVDWQALDRAPVRLVFMIGGPDNKQKEYLHILSALTAALKDEDRRKKILQAATTQEVLNLIKALQ